jgi:integrase
MKISYRVVNRSLRVRIKPSKLPASIFNSELFVDKTKFDAKKQICGDPKVQAYMESTTKTLLKLHEPGMSAKEVWDTFLASQTKRDSYYMVKDAFEYYLRTADGAPSTIKNIETVYSKVKQHGFQNTPINQITGATMREFLKNLSYYKESTQYEVYMKLKTVLNRYVRENALGFKPPIDGLMKPPRKVEQEEPEYLTWAEVVSLMEIELADPKEGYFRDLFCLMCLTGMAVGDLLKFNPKKSVSADGKWFQYKRQKTGNACISIPLLPMAKTIIDRNIWPVMLSVRTIQYKCDLISMLIGRTIKSHGARKTFGCVMLELGFSMEACSKMLGHSSILITQKHYCRITTAKIEREMSNLPDEVKKMMNV